MKQFRVFTIQKRKLLQKRNLQGADGRSLFEYRLTEEEFYELEDTLRSWLKKLIGHFQLGQVLRLPGFPALFVLYAAEWWRRRYDGSGFSWEPILRDLKVEPDSWTPGERSQCVNNGLKAWGLKPRKSGALRFLGAIAIQGGLPLRLLAQARGGVGRLLYRVLQLAEGRQVSKEEIHDWVESLRHTLPKSYRQELIYTLLSEMVATVLDLKRKAGLSASDDAVPVLDRKIPDWKQRFPLSLDDEHARTLVEQLVKDAASIQIRKIKPSLPVERYLEKDEEGLWHLVSRIELPRVLEEKALARIFELDIADFPRTATLALLAGDHILQTKLRRLAGGNSYRLEATEWQLDGEAAGEEHLLQLSAADGRIWTAEAHKGEALDAELPWIFEEEKPFRLLKQGGGKVSPAKVLLALHKTWKLKDGEALEESCSGGMRAAFRDIYQVQGRVELLDSNGHQSIIHTGQATATEQQLIWMGERLWLDFISPRQAYKGLPQLYKVDEEGARQRVEGRPACTVLGAPNNHQTLGPVVLRYPANGDHKIQTRMVLLPQEAKVELQAADAKSGNIQFLNWGLNSVKTLNASAVQSEIQHEENALTLQVAAGEGVSVPEWLQLELSWPHTTQTARMRLPYPATGARVFDGTGTELHSGDQLSVHDLLGVRLIVNLAGSVTRKVELNISSGHLARCYPLRIGPGALKIEVSLADYLTDIQHLLSMDDSPDSQVTVALWAGNQSIIDLKIARYAAIMERTVDRVYIETMGTTPLEVESLEKCRVYAARLEYPADEPIELEPAFSEGVHSGGWWFDPGKREPGTWLIYPAPDSRVMFRACIWPVEGEVNADDKLIQDLSEPNQYLRELGIQKAIAEMAEDYGHPSWQIVEQLASQYGHLPLATLDLWRMFAHAYDGMAALALRVSDLPKDFYLRFARKMPFVWELVPLKAWRNAIGQLRQQCLNQYGTEVGEEIFHSHLESRLQALGAECGALYYLLGIARVDHDQQVQNEFMALKSFIGPGAKKELFEGDDSKLMRLRRIHADDDDWPTGFSVLLGQAKKDPDILPFLYSEHYGYTDGVINMPLLAAATVVHNKTADYFSNPDNVHLLRTFRAFDMDWFDDAFNLTIARCLAEGDCDDY